MIGRLLDRLNRAAYSGPARLFSALHGSGRRSAAGADWARDRGRSGFGRRVLVFASVLALGAGIAGGAWAFFHADAQPGAAAEAIAASLPKGNKPTLSRSDRDVTVSWAQNSIAALGGDLGVASHGGYVVSRYAVNDPSTPIAPGSACDGTQSGSDDPLSCIESGVPTGRWTYTVEPKYWNWLGPESDQSAQVNVPPAVPTSVSLANGGGVGNAYINTANQGHLNVDVVLPSTSLSTDTVDLLLTDGTHNVPASKSGTAGAGTLHFTGLDGSALNDGSITIKAKSTSSYGDASDFTSTTVTKDTVAPVVSPTASRPPDSNGWYNHSVTFSAGGSDTGGSGIDHCDADVIYSSPDTSTGSETFNCTDKAGNTGTGSISFKYDSTAPVSSSTGSDGNWHNSAVTVHLSATDAGAGESGVAKIVYTVDGGAAQTINADHGDVTISAPAGHSNDGTHTISFHAVDVAGNVESPDNTATVKIDTSKPVITATAKNADNSAYTAGTWTNQSVTVSFTCADALSGLASNNVDGGGTQIAETNSGSFSNTGSCTDNAGNTADPVTFSPIKVDKTKPVISPTALNADNSVYAAGTWTHQSVTVSFSCADAGLVESGLASNTVGGGGTQSSETSNGSFTNTGSCTDNAGNTANPFTFSPIMIDKTNPLISAAAKNADNSTYTAGNWTNQTVTVHYTCSETGSVQSGIATCTSDQTFGSTGITSSTSGTAVDNAGNSQTATFGPIKVDKVNPTPGTLSIPSRIDNSYSLTNTATDANSGIASVHYYYCSGTCTPNPGNAGTTEIGSGSTTGPNYPLAWSSQPADGTYSVLAQAVDNAGNKANSNTVTTTVDNTAPTVTLTKVNGSTVTFPFLTKSSVTTIGGACSLGAGDSTTVNWSVSAGPSPAPESGSTTCTSSAWSATLTTALSSDGNYTVSASQSDTAQTTPNTGTSGNQSITIDKTAPSGSSIASSPNPKDGLPDNQSGSSPGDQIIYTFSEQMDPNSIKSGWNGSSISVTASFTHCSGNSSPDCLAISGVNLGTVALNGSYVQNGNKSYTVAATMAMATVSGKSVVTVTLTATPSTNTATDTASHTMVWTPSASATDLAGNACSTSTVSESSAAENF